MLYIRPETGIMFLSFSKSKDGLYAIGYVAEQSNLGKNTVLTSTVQNVDKAYTLIAEQ